MKIMKRYLALVLSFALFLALPLAFTQEAAAASKGTKILQPSLMVRSTSYGGETSSSVTAYSYNSKGLQSAEVYQNGEMEAYAYNKSGYMTMSAYLDKKGVPQYQTVFNVKNGKTKSAANYDLDGGKVTLTDYHTFSYKKGKLAKVVSSSADGTSMDVRTYKNGVPSQYVSTYADPTYNIQTIRKYDKYGNITSGTSVMKFSDGETVTTTTVYKNTYKKDLLVKTVYTEASNSSWDSAPRVVTGMNVYTYKKGKLVKADKAYSYQNNPSVTYGNSYTYSYGKGGLITAESRASVIVTPTESKITSTTTEAYQYKKVAVDKKCVNAVKEAMEYYSYERFIPGYDFPVIFD